MELLLSFRPPLYAHIGVIFGQWCFLLALVLFFSCYLLKTGIGVGGHWKRLSKASSMKMCYFFAPCHFLLEDFHFADSFIVAAKQCPIRTGHR